MKLLRVIVPIGVIFLYAAITDGLLWLWSVPYRIGVLLRALPDHSFVTLFFETMTLISIIFFYSAVNFFKRYRASCRINLNRWLWIDKAIVYCLFLILFLFWPWNFLNLIIFQHKWILIGVSIWLGGALWWSFIEKFQKKKIVNRKAIDIQFFSNDDAPIEFKEQDLLGRKSFIVDFENIIRSLCDQPQIESFVLSLQGGWGGGKTSVLNIVKNNLQNNENILTVDFNPWYYWDQDAIVEAFFRQIESAINRKFLLADISDLLRKYPVLIKYGLSHLPGKFDRVFPIHQETIDEIKQRIEQWLIGRWVEEPSTVVCHQFSK
ncbi:MAG: KAP family NTPase [Candidatus Omnitrophica bacterium]|nr:KAP family NTPase [Candidatus Omnitrophota bacterium]